MLKKLEGIYNETKLLDHLTFFKYSMASFDSLRKYQLLIEIEDLINKAHSCNFWQNGKRDYHQALPEYISCLFIILYFCNYFQVELDEEFPSIDKQSLQQSFFHLYDLSVQFSQNSSKEKIKEILVQLLYVAQLLHFSFEDVTKESQQKSFLLQKKLTKNEQLFFFYHAFLF